jgi:fluoride exporter
VPHELPLDPDVEDSTEPATEDVFRRPTGRRARTWSRFARSADVIAVVAVGGGVGSLARYGVTQWLPPSPRGFPWATFLVNTVGCLLLGLLMVFVAEVWSGGRYARPLLGVGLLGGMTTFSTMTLDAHRLGAGHAWLLANEYVVVSFLAGLAGVWLGVVCARLLVGAPLRHSARRARRGETS